MLLAFLKFLFCFFFPVHLSIADPVQPPFLPCFLFFLNTDLPLEIKARHIVKVRIAITLTFNQVRLIHPLKGGSHEPTLMKFVYI